MSKLNRLVTASVAALAIIACEGTGTPYVPTIGKSVPVVPKGGVPEQISLLLHTLGLRVGQQSQLATSGLSPSSWFSDNTRIATVSSNGTVSGVAPGTAHVVAAAQSSADTALVTVVSAVASVQLVSHTVNIAVGQSAPLSFAALDSAGKPATAWNVRWASTAPQTVFVDQTGNVSAVVLGQASVIVTADGKSDTALVSVVPVPIATVQLSAPTSFSLDVGTTHTLTATPRDAAGNILFSRAFVWASGSAAVATVSQAGLVTAVGGGTTTITATSEGKSASTSLTVLPVAIVGVTLGSAAIKIGQLTQATAAASDINGSVITGRQVSWSSQNVGVASVTGQGAVQGVAGGSAQIVATIDGVSGSATVNVLVPPPAGSSVASVSVTVTPSTLLVGQSGQATATAHDSLGNTISGLSATWTSSNTGVATVSATGLVTAIANGTASITGVIQGKSGAAAVAVGTPAPPSPGHPNEPAGMTRIASNSFDAINTNGWWYAYGTASLSIVNDPTSPASQPNVMRVAYPAGTYAVGGGPGGIYLTESPFNMAPTELYISYWWKLDPNFLGNTSGNGNYKHFYTTFENNDWDAVYNSNGGSYAGVDGIHSSITASQTTAWFIPAGTTDPVQKVWNPSANGGAGGYMHLDGTLPNGGGQTNIFPNLAPYTASLINPDSSGAGPQVSRGAWHHTEILYVLNTDGNVDGQDKMWLDGVQIWSFSIEWSTLMGRFMDAWYSGQVPYGPNITIPTTYYEYFDDFYISGGYARPGEQPDHYVPTPSTTAPTPGQTVTIVAQLVDANGKNARAPGQHVTATATVGTPAFSGYSSLTGGGSKAFTLVMPNSHGASVTFNVTDTGVPPRTGTLTITVP